MDALDGGFPSSISEEFDLSFLVVTDDKEVPDKTTEGVIATTLVLLTVLQVLMNGSLAQLWGFINGM